MKQLKVKDIFVLINQLKQAGMTTEEIAAMPIYIGDDDELNGIHTAWYANFLDPNDPDEAPVVEMINDTYGNEPIKAKSILIS